MHVNHDTLYNFHHLVAKDMAEFRRAEYALDGNEVSAVKKNPIERSYFLGLFQGAEGQREGETAAREGAQGRPHRDRTKAQPEKNPFA